MKRNFFIVIRLRRLLWVAGLCVAVLAAALFWMAREAAQVSSAKEYDHPAYMAIVIDDFGQARAGVKDMLALPLEITCAIMPNMEFTQQDADDAHAVGKEVIVHMPMQAHESDPMSWYGPEPIMIWHGYEEARDIAARAVKVVPHAVGMNIHIGSRSSEKEKIVTGVMEVCKENDLYFLDSLTSMKSVCEKLAREYEVPFLTRHVFMENGNRTKAHAIEQLKLAVEMAKRRGSSVCVGHVGPEGGKNTVEAIREMIPYFAQQGVEIVSASKLLDLPENARPANTAIPQFP